MKRRKEEIGNRKQRGGRRRCGCCMSAGGAAIIVVVCPPGDAVGQLRPALAALETEYGSRKSQQRLSRVPEKVGRCLRCHVNTPAALSNCRFRRERVDGLPFAELLPVRAKRAGVPLFPGGTEKKRDGEEKRKKQANGVRVERRAGRRGGARGHLDLEHVTFAPPWKLAMRNLGKGGVWREGIRRNRSDVLEGQKQEEQHRSERKRSATISNTHHARRIQPSLGRSRHSVGADPVSAGVHVLHHVSRSDLQHVLVCLLPAGKRHALALVLSRHNSAGGVAASLVQAACRGVQTAADNVEKILHKVQQIQARKSPPLQAMREVHPEDGPPLSMDKQLHRIQESLAFSQICVLDFGPHPDRFRVLHKEAMARLQDTELPSVLCVHPDAFPLHREHAPCLVCALDCLNPLHQGALLGHDQPDHDRVLGVGPHPG